MSTQPIVWEDPPPSTRRHQGSHWTRFIQELQQHPGKWAIARSGAYNLCTRTGAHLRSLGCETTTRVQPDKSGRLYARWPEDAS